MADKFAEYRKHKSSAMQKGLLTKENGVLAVLAVAILIVWALAWPYYFPSAVKPDTNDRDQAAPPQRDATGEYEPQEELVVVFFDVGQGDATAVLTPAGNVFLIDGGEGSPQYRENRYIRAADAGNLVILPFLKDRYIDDLKAVFLTHPHSDHYGGLLDVCRVMDVASFYDSGKSSASFGYRNLLQLIQQKDITYLNPKPGEELSLDPDLKLQVLTVDPNADDVNDASICLRIVYKSVSFLITGDAEESVERKLVAEYGDALRSDVLQVGHHGSRTSSIKQFIDAVQPRYAIVSVGSYNRYGHPNDDVMERLDEAGIKVLRSDEVGTVTMVSDGNNLDVETEK